MLNNRTGWALSAAAIMLLIPLEQLPAQTRPTGTPGVPTQSSPTGTPTTTGTTVTVNPKAVINAVGGLFKKKPKPVPTPVPTPAPAAVSIPVVQAIPTSAPRPRAQAKPAPVPRPTPQPRVSPIKPPPVRPAAAAPVPQPIPSAAAVPELIVPPATMLPAAPVQSPLWLWLAALLAAVGLGELMRRWFWPVPKLACDFERGSAKLTGWSSPVLSPPEVQFNVAIDLGVASAPSGVSIQPLEKLS